MSYVETRMAACEEIVRVCEKHGITLLLTEALDAWKWHSNNLAAGWLVFDAVDPEGEILRAVRGWREAGEPVWKP